MRDTCQEKAIFIIDEISRIDMTSHPVYEKVCSVCGKTHKTVREYDEMCVACKKREKFSRKKKGISTN